MTDARRGLLYGVIVYGLWGVVPLFWKLLADVPPAEIVAHRAVWGVVVLLGICAIAGALPAVRAGLRSPRVVRAMLTSATLIAFNWGVFIYAVATHHVLDVSLGYFINPLLSVGLGVIVLGERLRRAQIAALVLATVGVVVMAVQVGHVPWIALLLASSFAGYGFVRKRAPIDSLPGGTIETALLAGAGAIYLGWLAVHGDGVVGHAPLRTHALLALAGIVTAGPLLLFTAAARRLPLSTLGFLQYLAPSLQFVVAVTAFGEQLSTGRLAAFGCIWLALALFSIDLWRGRPVVIKTASTSRAGSSPARR